MRRRGRAARAWFATSYVWIAGATCGAAGCGLGFADFDGGGGNGTSQASSTTTGTAAEGAVTTGPIDEVWGCLGKVTEPAPDLDRPMTVALKLTDMTGEPMPETTVVDVCAREDIDCDRPHASGLHPDEKGDVAADLYFGFDGYVRIAHPDFVPSRVYVGRPLFEQPKADNVLVLKKAQLALAVTLAACPGSPTGRCQVDPEKGQVLTVGLDCAGIRQAGIAFGLDVERELQFYLSQLRPDPEATETDSSGFGGFLNVVPTNQATAFSVRADDVAKIGNGTFPVRAGEVSYILLSPSP